LIHSNSAAEPKAMNKIQGGQGISTTKNTGAETSLNPARRKKTGRCVIPRRKDGQLILASLANRISGRRRLRAKEQNHESGGAVAWFRERRPYRTAQNMEPGWRRRGAGPRTSDGGARASTEMKPEERRRERKKTNHRRRQRGVTAQD
jgi:hypothetical protein